jgi:tryptophan-rich sensory protein
MTNQFEWYSTLIKPTWAPPSWIFSPVWTVLYVLIAISFGFIFYKRFKNEIEFKIVLPFLLNIIFNLIFTPIQFVLRNNALAFIDVFLVWVTLIWAMIVIYRKYRWVVYISIPYLLWVSFATILAGNVWWLNR